MSAPPHVQPKQAAEMDVRLWKKRHAQARVRREYRTADEVLAEAAECPQAAPKQTIIDMRGPQVQAQAEQLPLGQLASMRIRVVQGCHHVIMQPLAQPSVGGVRHVRLARFPAPSAVSMHC